MIFTRDLINKNIKFHEWQGFDNSPKSCDFNYISSLVDAYKNLLLSKGASPGQTVVIGTNRVEQYGLIFACAELGLAITIVGNLIPTTLTTKNNLHKNLLPIDFFIVVDENCTTKFEFLNSVCEQTIKLRDEKLNYTPNDKILATEKDTLLKCLISTMNQSDFEHSVVYHTHEFICNLSIRNSKTFYGNIGIPENLNHGSSPAVFLFPCLLSDNVTNFYKIDRPRNQTILLKYLENNNIFLDHYLLSYNGILDDNKTISLAFKDCTIYTLSIIRKDWVNNFKQSIKDIISIFGTSEISGPVLINKASYNDFTENTYRKVDDFYKINLVDGKLEVFIPTYNKSFQTNDMFEIDQDKYIHKGRVNLLRMNDLIVNITEYQKIINDKINAQLIVDTIKDSMYLAIWDNTFDENIINDINDQFKLKSDGRHFISKYECVSTLERNTQTLLDYFRNKV